MAETQIRLFAKMPAPGRVKTRLVPPLTPQEAAAVHLASLRDVVVGARRTGAPLRLVYDDVPGAAEYFAKEFPGVEREPQCAGDLGRRLSEAFAAAFAAGATSVVAIGADSPTLPPEFLAQGLAATPNSGAALGPAADGGYYLIGLRHDLWPAGRALFEEIPWSTERVFQTTLSRSATIGVRPHVLPTWYDIDRIEDLLLARTHAPGDSHLARLLEARDWRAHVDFTEG